ncbi:imelysin family protein [Bacteroides faecalis]|uniref:Peptidase M75 n=1 Tax=Bacteroides faecalis TaxID=2447885 RepID=A0A401LQW5_9BACE|nr:imelysin family protein [Bacteroides faecalis]GCB33861.1 peptidase M75 [Bacteroides faecalis]
MRKNIFYTAILIAGLTFTTTACSNDDDNDTQSPIDLECTQNNVASWGNYMKVVATLLKNDAANLYSDWNNSYEGGDSYAEIFKKHNSTTFSSALNCVQQIIDGCYDIANEVGTQKIGDPYEKYEAGNISGALYAVESWYSWHSREDYSNNILSIRNAYYGTRDGSINDNSISKILANNGYSELNNQMIAAINKAYDTILDIPQPFRNNINSSEAEVAMEACAELANLLTNTLKPTITNNSTLNSNSTLDPIVKQYVDVVVLPTYLDLKNETEALYQTVSTFQANPSNAAFTTAALAWVNARVPWERSEAFLFGPVASKGLDPNMDSWPLDQDAIVNILNSGNYADLEWSGDYDEDNEDIAAAQNVRGFHTLEYLLFKDGKARTIK